MASENIHEITDEDILAYLIKEGSKTKEELIIEIQERFNSYDDFKHFAFSEKP
jgi:hypothetical protein